MLKIKKIVAFLSPKSFSNFSLYWFIKLYPMTGIIKWVKWLRFLIKNLIVSKLEEWFYFGHKNNAFEVFFKSGLYIFLSYTWWQVLKRWLTVFLRKFTFSAKWGWHSKGSEIGLLLVFQDNFDYAEMTLLKGRHVSK